MSSLLAARGMEEETDCIGAMTYIHWWGNWRKMQPETYVRDEVCGDLIEQMRCGPLLLPPAPGGGLRDKNLEHLWVLGAWVSSTLLWVASCVLSAINCVQIPGVLCLVNMVAPPLVPRTSAGVLVSKNVSQSVLIAGLGAAERQRCSCAVLACATCKAWFRLRERKSCTAAPHARASGRRMSEYGCDNPGAIASTPGTFARLEDLTAGRCRWGRAPYEPLSGQCHLFSRKWGADTADAVLGLFELEETLQMLDGRAGACAAEAPREAPAAAGALVGAKGVAAVAA